MKKLFCRHEYSKPINKIKYINGLPIYRYGKECVKCGKVRWA